MSQYFASRQAALAIVLALVMLPVILTIPFSIFFDTRTYRPLYLAAQNPPSALPQKATANDLKWQPVLDFGNDGCYNVPAIDAAGNIVKGLDHDWASTSEGCHDESDLDNNNVYSRQRCNNGWCIYIYDYYFEKDVAIPHFLDTGHKHDWEHVAVWVSDNKVQYVGASQHGNYEVRPASDVLFEGNRPKMVYHKDGASTHCFRFATKDDEEIKNAKGVWFRGDLVSYNGFPSGIRDKLYAHDFGKANIALKDSSFPNQIEKAKPDNIKFDINLDESSPGYP
ncbi:Necrosis inducing protein (NPP1) [Geosmithia morbida]|uniref:Necrosis inducing protein (NPP1) n=1 Tax=Geosmithia morbida TaxID=1094350 RepID=A0A9P4YRC6_9HYPO|nr:Necrosis inducing protein (NPP1) [Geosmithia morbida]KAF4120412.1 Necrosis inducing protein (NPP1) [Geosmithia morbida]